MPGFESPAWTDSWFPDAFIGTMAQLLIALETGRQPAISGRDNLKTMALVEAAYLSAASFRSIDPETIVLASQARGQPGAVKPRGFFNRLFSAPSVLAGTTAARSMAEKEGLDNFTPRAQQALALARKEAERFHHNFVGTEHLLLGLIGLGMGVAVNVLQKLGLDLQTVRSEVEKQIGTGQGRELVGHIPYTPRVKKVLALAAKEAKSLNHAYVGTEHLLLGMLREGDGVAARVLTSLKIELEKTRLEILKELDPNFGGTQGESFAKD